MAFPSLPLLPAIRARLHLRREKGCCWTTKPRYSLESLYALEFSRKIGRPAVLANTAVPAESLFHYHQILPFKSARRTDLASPLPGRTAFPRSSVQAALHRCTPLGAAPPAGRIFERKRLLSGPDRLSIFTQQVLG